MSKTLRRISQTQAHAMANMLRRLEYSASIEGQPTCMGGDNGGNFSACPVCHGPKPSPAARQEFSTVGHTSTCRLHVLLTR